MFVSTFECCFFTTKRLYNYLNKTIHKNDALHQRGWIRYKVYFNSKIQFPPDKNVDDTPDDRYKIH